MVTETFTDLVSDAGAWPCIKQRFPLAELDDASDFIHEGRFQVRIPGTTDDDFYPFIISEGWGLVCLGLRLMMQQREYHDKVRGWIDSARSMAPEGAAS